VDVETTGTNPDRDKIIEFGICLFEYDRQSGRMYKVLGSWEWFEDPGCSIPPEITNITGITDEMVAGHTIDDRAVDDLLSRVVLVIAHNADFDRRFLERRHPTFAAKHWACSRFDIDWKAEGIRSSALEFVAYSLGFFHDGHRAASDCRATLHALAQRLPCTGRLALQALLEQARLPTWRIWAKDAAIEKKDALKARGYTWSPGEFGRPKCLLTNLMDPSLDPNASIRGRNEARREGITSPVRPLPPGSQLLIDASICAVAGRRRPRGARRHLRLAVRRRRLHDERQRSLNRGSVRYRRCLGGALQRHAHGGRGELAARVPGRRLDGSLQARGAQPGRFRQGPGGRRCRSRGADQWHSSFMDFGTASMSA
jgi:DNA polymerase-3 subunit epsilon